MTQQIAQLVEDMTRVLHDMTAIDADLLLADYWEGHTALVTFAANRLLEPRFGGLEEAAGQIDRHVEQFVFVARSASMLEVRVPVLARFIQRAIGECLQSTEHLDDIVAFIRLAPNITLSLAEYVGRVGGPRGRVVQHPLRLLHMDGAVCSEYLNLFIPHSQ